MTRATSSHLTSTSVGTAVRLALEVPEVLQIELSVRSTQKTAKIISGHYN